MALRCIIRVRVRVSLWMIEEMGPWYWEQLDFRASTRELPPYSTTPSIVWLRTISFL